MVTGDRLGFTFNIQSHKVRRRRVDAIVDDKLNFSSNLRVVGFRLLDRGIR